MCVKQGIMPIIYTLEYCFRKMLNLGTIKKKMMCDHDSNTCVKNGQRRHSESSTMILTNFEIKEEINQKKPHITHNIAITNFIIYIKNKILQIFRKINITFYKFI
jgi:hypothetical protein